MEMLKFGKFAALALAMAVAVGCSSKGGDAAVKALLSKRWLRRKHWCR
jgi:hypothetical protein